MNKETANESNEHAFHSEETPHYPALSSIIARYVAGILIVGMAIYGVAQYYLMPDKDVTELVFEHLGHIVFLMLLVYITLYFVLLKVVVSPIHRFRAKLYRVAGGDLTHIKETSRISEMHEMADGINVMIARLATGLPYASLADLSEQARTLRNLAQQSENMDYEQKETLLVAAEKIENLVSLFTKNLVRGKKNGK